VVFARLWPIWAEGTLLFPTIAGLVHLFRPKKREVKMTEQAPAPPALSEHPTQKLVKRMKRQATLPSPAVGFDLPQDSSSSRAS
jgi:hypothetical protein